MSVATKLNSIANGRGPRAATYGDRRIDSYAPITRRLLDE